VLICKSRDLNVVNINNDENMAQAIRLLYESGDAKPNALLTKDNGSTILAMAADHLISNAIFKLLLDLGEDPTIVNSEGESALSIAQKKGKTGLVNLFKEWRIYKSGLMRWAIQQRTSGRLGKDIVDKMVRESYYQHQPLARY
jgi:ankyrin repeat protein